ncbi:MAG: hypothetical protein KDD66_05430 [Bdellovibrionales bacterium]|nr:hypothetical protein [Bdellovibrionales bacterium]
MALSIIVLFAPICVLSLNIQYAFESASEALDGGTEGVPPTEPGGKDKADGENDKDS